MKKDKKLDNLGITGSKGEDIATEYLSNKGYKITERNYRTKWGEIDIVCKKDRTLYFFEVKSVECANESEVLLRRPEERVNEQKRLKLQRVVRSYLLDEFGTEERGFEFGIVSVALVSNTRKAFVRVIREVL